MAALIRRKGNPAAGTAHRRLQTPRQIRALRASASVLIPGRRESTAALTATRQAWQKRAWDYRDEIGELRYAIGFLGNSARRMVMYPGVYMPGESTPVRVEDSDLRQHASVAQDALDRIGDVGTRGDLLRDQMENFEVAGEALDVNTLVATPDGFKKMGELQPGDRVLGGDGRPCSVIAAHPIAEGRDCYEVLLSGDISVVADGNHLWLTHEQRDRQKAQQYGYQYRPTVLTTTDLMDSIRGGPTPVASNHAIELTTVVGTAPARPVRVTRFPIREKICSLYVGLYGSGRGKILPFKADVVDPYVLGYWLGDGTSTTGSITVHPSDQPHLQEQVEAAGYGWAPGIGRDGILVQISGLKAQLRSLGVLGNKHIPAVYLRHTEQARWALLQGLIDSDGYIDKLGRVEFSNTNQRLLWEVAELAASLGLRPGRPCRNRVTFTGAGAPVARLPRKAARIRPRREQDRWRYVRSVERVKSRPVRCITVDSPDSTFLVTQHLVRTHNCYLVGREDDGDGLNREVWEIRSISEVHESEDGKIMLRDLPNQSGAWSSADSSVYILQESDYFARMWVPHPRWRRLADSPLRAAESILEELSILSKDVRAAGVSRLANNGILLMPDDLMVVRAGTDEADDEAEDDPFMSQLIEAARTAIRDPGSAAAAIPIVARGPAEALDKVKLLTMQRPESENAGKRTEALSRLATSLDLPVEVLTGIADINHWGAWMVDDSTFRHHVEPLVQLEVDAWTAGYYRRYLIEAEVPPEAVARMITWYDPTELLSKPDKSQDAKDLWAMGALSWESLRRHTGFTEDEKPDDQETILHLLVKQQVLDPALANQLVALMDPRLKPVRSAVPVIGPSPVGEPSGGPVGDQPPPVTGPPPAAGPPTEQQPPNLAARVAEIRQLRRQQGHPSELWARIAQVRADREAQTLELQTLLAASRSAPDWAYDLSRGLAERDQQLREVLRVACEAAVRRTLERAGAKVVSRARTKDTVAAASIRETPLWAVAGRLGPPVVAALGLAEDNLLQGELTDLERVWSQYVTSGQTQALRDAARLVGMDVNTAFAQLDGTFRSDRAAGWSYLRNALERNTRAGLVADPTALVETGQLVPTSDVRAAIAVAGGFQTSTSRGINELTGLPVDPKEHYGQLGTGTTVKNYLEQNGAKVERYRWMHGFSINSFPPHAALDGYEFDEWDDGRLQRAGFPGDLHPGDHRGCFVAGTDVAVGGLQRTFERPYAGELVDVRLASGNHLRCTPNHPIMTQHGWIAAGQLNQGDHVVGCFDPERVARLVKLDDHQYHAPIEQIARAFGAVTATVRTESTDFHGDGINEEVCVIRAEGLLGDSVVASVAHPLREELLVSRIESTAVLPGSSCLNQSGARDGLTTQGGGSEFAKRLALGGRAPSGDQAIGLLKAPSGAPSPVETASNRSSAEADLFGNGLIRITSPEQFHQLRVENVRSVVGAGLLYLDTVVRVRSERFVGQVFNLQTESGWYIANHIISSNCHCDVVLVWVPPAAVVERPNPDRFIDDELMRRAMTADGAFYASNTARVSDGVLEALVDRVGFGHVPRSVSQTELDQMIGSGQIDAYRAMDAGVDQFKNGAYYGGAGHDGNGIYLMARPGGFDYAEAARRDYLGDDYKPSDLADLDDRERRRLAKIEDQIRSRHREVAMTYGDQLMHLTLDPKARILSRDELVRQQTTYLNELRQKATAAGTSGERERIELWIRAMQDPGRFAAATGVEAYWGSVPGELIVLNRGRLVVGA